MGKVILSGILWTFVGVFPAALIVGILFHFPIPFFDYVSGWKSAQGGIPPLDDLPPLIFKAALLYAFLGCIPLAILGTGAGLIGWKLGGQDHAKQYTRNIAIGLAFIPVLILAVLDKIIGPW